MYSITFPSLDHRMHREWNPYAIVDGTWYRHPTLAPTFHLADYRIPENFSRFG